MDTPPREKKASALHPRQLHARIKMQMESDLDAEMSHPAVERMDETLVHTNVIKPVADDFDDDDLE